MTVLSFKVPSDKSFFEKMQFLTPGAASARRRFVVPVRTVLYLYTFSHGFLAKNRFVWIFSHLFCMNMTLHIHSPNAAPDEFSASRGKKIPSAAEESLRGGDFSFLMSVTHFRSGSCARARGGASPRRGASRSTPPEEGSHHHRSNRHGPYAGKQEYAQCRRHLG